jgi:hypothetical protein
VLFVFSADNGWPCDCGYGFGFVKVDLGFFVFLKFWHFRSCRTCFFQTLSRPVDLEFVNEAHDQIILVLRYANTFMLFLWNMETSWLQGIDSRIWSSDTTVVCCHRITLFDNYCSM